MTDSASPKDASLSDEVARPVASRWAKFWGQLKRFRGPIAAIAAFGAVLSGLLGYWHAYETVQTVVVPKSPPAAVTADAGPLSIVVLPFQNLTGDLQQAYVADGLTASLTADLSRIRDPFIVNAAQQVGRELGVHFVLQGSVQRSGTKIRINAQLADASSNAQLWSESFEGDQSDLFALQDQVTARIGNSIGREMVIVVARESESRKSSPKVADLMLRARALGLKPQSLTNLRRQEDLYRQALALDPNSASAMVELAVSLVLQANNFSVDLDESVKEKDFLEGRQLALKAKERDPDNAGVYIPIAIYAAHHGDWEGALRAAETRLSLEPKNPSAYNNAAAPLYLLGKPQEAIELLTQAINLDPKHADDTVCLNMAYAHLMLGDNDAAIEWILKGAEKNPAKVSIYATLAMAYALKGEDAKARAAVEEVHRLDPNWTLSARRRNDSSKPTQYKAWFESNVVPAWRKAGLPE